MTTATLSWTDPIARTDGASLSPAEIAGIDIYDSASPVSSPIGSVLPGVGTFTTDTLTVGDHAFTLVVRDTSGHSSAPSNAALVQVAPVLAAPQAVVDLVAVANP